MINVSREPAEIQTKIELAKSTLKYLFISPFFFFPLTLSRLHEIENSRSSVCTYTRIFFEYCTVCATRKAILEVSANCRINCRTF